MCKFSEKLVYCDAVVTQILFVKRFDVLFGDNGDDDFLAKLVDDLLVEVVRPQPALFLLESEEVAAGFGHNFRIGEVRFRDRREIQCGVHGEKPYFFLREAHCEESVRPPPLIAGEGTEENGEFFAEHLGVVEIRRSCELRER